MMANSDLLTVETLLDQTDTVISGIRSRRALVERSRQVVDHALASDKALYGINTGFGALAGKRVESGQLTQLQHNLILSHAVGVGDPVPRDISRLMLVLKLNALSLGYSGISVETFDRLLFFLENDLIPVVPSKGSVGASGDLAPLAHMALPLIGRGSFWATDGIGSEPAADVLERFRLEALSLSPKDGLALINGTQLMSAFGAFVLRGALGLVKAADVISAMSLEALQGSIRPFDHRLHAVRPHPGQSAVAQNVRTLLEASEILESHRECGKVQDPYCLRCVPQVHGASRDALDFARRTVEIEINSVTDNPLVFEDGDIISGGNFHGQPLALALDFAAIALAELGSISERRTYLLLEGHDGLPKLLMTDTGINSGFMIPQYTAAALVSENKVLCHPASVDSIPTSLGQEDHVSMGSISALKLVNVFRNAGRVLAIELFTAAQALDYRRPLRAGKGVEAAHNLVRQFVSHTESDHFFNDELARCYGLISDESLVRAVESTSALV
jgi:histidine ammonia-lyase